MKNIVIVGGSAVSGQSIIQALKASKENQDTRIFATTSSEERQVPGADFTIGGIDVSQPDAPEKLADAIASSTDEPIDAIMYIPARGPVGFSATKATQEQIQEALEYSFLPLLKMRELLKPKQSISTSGFITMEPLMEVYGAMTFSKLMQEKIAQDHPNEFRILRIGMFMSNSVRGIAILVQRNLMKKTNPEMQPMYDEWKASGQKFQDFFYAKNYRFEEENYRHVSEIPFRPTEPADIGKGFLYLMNETKDPIVNVLGPWVWSEKKMLEVPGSIRDQWEAIPSVL